MNRVPLVSLSIGRYKHTLLVHAGPKELRTEVHLIFAMGSFKHMIVKLSLVVLPAGNGGLEGRLQRLHRVVHAVVRAEPRLLDGRRRRGAGGGRGRGAAPRRGRRAGPATLLLPERGILKKKVMG